MTRFPMLFFSSCRENDIDFEMQLDSRCPTPSSNTGIDIDIALIMESRCHEGIGIKIFPLSGYSNSMVPVGFGVKS